MPLALCSVRVYFVRRNAVFGIVMMVMPVRIGKVRVPMFMNDRMRMRAFVVRVRDQVHVAVKMTAHERVPHGKNTSGNHEDQRDQIGCGQRFVMNRKGQSGSNERRYRVICAGLGSAEYR